MNCQEVRQFIEPYLDSELDTETTFRVEQHLEACQACSRLFTHEQEWEELFRKTLKEESRSPELWHDIEAKIGKPRIWRRLTQRLALFKGVILAGIIAGIGAMVLPSFQADASGGPLIKAAQECHQAYLNGIVTADFEGPIPTNFVQRLKGRLDKKAFKYLPEVPEFESQGSRLCTIKGMDVAWRLGKLDSTSISVIVFSEADLERFPHLKEKLEKEILCRRVNQFEFVAHRVDDYVVCVIGNINREKARNLAKAVRLNT